MAWYTAEPTASRPGGSPCTDALDSCGIVNATPRPVSSEGYQAALDQYRGNISSELTKVIANEDEADDSEEVDEEDLAEDSPVAQTVNIIIEYGVKAGASEPLRDTCRADCLMPAVRRIPNVNPG